MRIKHLGGAGVPVSAIGQGTMGVGGQFSPDASRDEAQIIALRRGIEAGMTFIDTAEIYGGGHAEEVVGQAVRGRREQVFIATKFSPEHSGYLDVHQAAERSLQRLGTDHIDLYQVHWPNPAVPISETMRALEELVEAGKIRHIGVSNFSLSQLREARAALAAHDIVSNQVEYNLFDRSIEKDILQYCEKEKIAVVAYSPLDQGKTTRGGADDVLAVIAQRYGKTASQIALNWLVAHPSVIPIPKALAAAHILENATACDFVLTKADQRAIDKAFDRPRLLVPTGDIKVSVQGEGARKVYQTVEEAMANRLGFCPSPIALATYIQAHPNEDIKPVRLVRPLEKEGGYEYNLVEGRVRYWAWVIAFHGSRAIPAYVRD